MKQADTETKKSRWADLGPRLLSAMVLLPLTALLLYLGDVWFAALVGLVFAGVYREWEIMLGVGKLAKYGYVLVGFIALSAIAFPVSGIVGVSIIIITAIIFAILTHVFAKLSLSLLLWRIAGLVYFGAVIIAILSIRTNISLGIVAGVFLATSVWMTDTGAFFAGRYIGGAKLSPDISPSKTWSGALGGLIVGALSGSLVWLIAVPSAWWIGLLLAGVLSLSGQLGDLLESAIKRRFKIKDSSDLIPGHGGLLDRLDSLTLASLVLFIIGFLNSGELEHITIGFLIW